MPWSACPPLSSVTSELGLEKGELTPGCGTSGRLEPFLLVVAEAGGIPRAAGVWELSSSFLCNVSVLLLLYSTDSCIGTLGFSPSLVWYLTSF